MPNIGYGKEEFLYTAAANATDVYDTIAQTDSYDARRDLSRAEELYWFIETGKTKSHRYTARRDMARYALLVAGVSEDAKRAANITRSATTLSDAELFLAIGDLDSLGLVNIKQNITA